MFTRITDEIVDSDDEGDDAGQSPYAADAILEVRDPYLLRPLPLLIGSQEFHQSDTAGLTDPVIGSQAQRFSFQIKFSLPTES